MNNDNRLTNFMQSTFAHVFILTAAFAALVHSTWSLATAFGGIEPPQLTQEWWAWLLPGFALAFTIDVGQVATSAIIQRGNRSPALYATFAVFAGFTFYLQWLYIATHLPVLPLSKAINPTMQEFAIGFRDLMPWLLPALLPLSTFLYTFSYAKPRRAPAKPATPKIEAKQQPALPPANAPQIEAGATPVEFAITCDLCEWSGTYATQRSATNALVAHKRHKHPTDVEVRGQAAR